jgi:hypothetical protein
MMGGQRFVGLLDLFPNAVFADSTRLLKYSHRNLPLKQVRRSSDNDEVGVLIESLAVPEITMNSRIVDPITGNIVSGTLGSFVGSGDGAVSIGFNQKGDGNNVTQTSESAQPLLISAGSLILVNGKAGVKYDGVNDYMQFLNNMYSSTLHIFTIISLNDSFLSNFQRFIHLSNGDDKSFQLTRSNSTASFQLLTKNTQNETGSTSLAWGSFLHQRITSVKTVDGGNTNLRVDSDPKTSGGGGSIGAGDGIVSTIGVRNDLLSSTFSSANKQEIIIFDSDQTANESIIETNMNAHFGVF